MTATLYDLGMADHSRAQEAMEITLDNQEFDTNEIMMTVIGKRATQCSWDDIQVALNRKTEPAGQKWIVFTKFMELRILLAGSL